MDSKKEGIFIIEMENINLDFEEIIINSKNILFIQDIDGVCIPFLL